MMFDAASSRILALNVEIQSIHLLNQAFWLLASDEQSLRERKDYHGRCDRMEEIWIEMQALSDGGESAPAMWSEAKWKAAASRSGRRLVPKI